MSDEVMARSLLDAAEALEALPLFLGYDGSD
jgi:hypothetical protein